MGLYYLLRKTSHKTFPPVQGRRVLMVKNNKIATVAKFSLALMVFAVITTPGTLRSDEERAYRYLLSGFELPALSGTSIVINQLTSPKEQSEESILYLQAFSIFPEPSLTREKTGPYFMPEIP
jgi:hypothetical protein